MASQNKGEQFRDTLIEHFAKQHPGKRLNEADTRLLHFWLDIAIEHHNKGAHS